MNLLHPRVGVRVVCRKRGQYTAQAPIEIDLPANADTLACNKYLLFVFFFLFQYRNTSRSKEAGERFCLEI